MAIMTRQMSLDIPCLAGRAVDTKHFSKYQGIALNKETTIACSTELALMRQTENFL
jgi:hypothetical protein